MGAHISIPMYQRSSAQRYRLMGLKCKACGTVNFPPKAGCQSCGKFGDFEEIQLCGKGKVYSYTIINGAGAPPEFAAEAASKGTYPVVLVELEEGPRIIAQMIEEPEQGPVIGMPVEAVIRRIYVEEEVIRYGYKFRPSKQV